VASRPKFWHRHRSRPQIFGLGLDLGLKHLALAWPRSAAEEPAAKKRSTDNLFADYRTSQYDRRLLLCERECEIKLCRFDHNGINSPVCCKPSSDTFYS